MNAQLGTMENTIGVFVCISLMIVVFISCGACWKNRGSYNFQESSGGVKHSEQDRV